MKCTQCGNETFIEGLRFPIHFDGRMDSGFEMFVCDKCGYVEFFFEKAMDYNREINKAIKSHDSMIDGPKQKLAKLRGRALELKTELKRIYESEVVKLEAIVANEDISVKQHKDAQSKLNTIKNLTSREKREMSGLDFSELPSKRELDRLEHQVKDLEKMKEQDILAIKRKYDL